MSAKSRDSAADGVLVIDKPGGISSFDVVRQLKRVLATRRIGHTGTLDPMATGLLVVAVGWSTRLVPYLMEGWKTYEGTILLGRRTSTDDVEGETLEQQVVPANLLDAVSLAEQMRSFQGAIQQVPPAVSAIKIDGERAYKRVLRGEEVEMQAREVQVDSFELLGLDGERISFRAHVGSGTYIRSLARDLGEQLGVGGCLASLRRTTNEPFVEADAKLLQEITGEADLLGPWEALRKMPAIWLSAEDELAFRQGKSLPLMPEDLPGSPDELFRIAGEDAPAELVGLARYESESGLLRPRRVRPLAD